MRQVDSWKALGNFWFVLIVTAFGCFDNPLRSYFNLEFNIVNFIWVPSARDSITVSVCHKKM